MNPSYDKSVQTRVEFVQAMGQQWNSMTEDEKKPFVKLAQKDSERFDREIKEYKRLATSQMPRV